MTPSAPLFRRLCRLPVVAALSAAGSMAAIPAPVPTDSAPAPASHRIVITVVDIKAPRYLPAILAERLGYFKDEGLLVTLMDEREDVPTDEMLMDGRTDACVGFYHHSFLSQPTGKLTESVVALAVTPGLKVLAAERLRDQVKTLADFKGRKIVVGGQKSSKNIIANYLVVRGGGQPSEYTALDGKGADKTIKALQSGAADLVVATEPDVSAYESKHAAYVVANLTSVAGTRENFGALFPTTCLYFSNAYVAAHPEAVRHLARAFIRTLKYLNAHTPEEIAALIPAADIGPDRETYLATLRESMQMFATDGLMADDAARKELEVMSAFDPKFKGVRIEDTYTNRFAEAALREPTR